MFKPTGAYVFVNDPDEVSVVFLIVNEALFFVESGGTLPHALGLDHRSLLQMAWDFGHYHTSVEISRAQVEGLVGLWDAIGSQIDVRGRLRAREEIAVVQFIRDAKRMLSR